MRSIEQDLIFFVKIDHGRICLPASSDPPPRNVFLNAGLLRSIKSRCVFTHFNVVSENKTLRKSRAGSSTSPRDQSDYDDVDLDEKSRTSPRAESAALSNTESRSSTKSAQKESQAVLDTISSADEREPLKSDVDEASVDNTGRLQYQFRK